MEIFGAAVRKDLEISDDAPPLSSDKPIKKMVFIFRNLIHSREQ